MADSKISALTALVAADVAGADVLPIVDTSATTTKKVSTADLAEYVSTSSAISNLLSPKAPLASPTFTGTPAAPTAAADTNTTQIATTGYVVGQAASATPLMNNTAAVGTSLKYARQDHIHPVDTSRAPLASPALTGTPTAPTAAVDTNTTQVATTAYVVGQGYAKLASPALTGTPTAPTAAVDTNTTQVATTAYVVGQGYAKLASPALTGTPTAPTAADSTNTTQVATTAFVQAQAQVDQFILASAIF